MPDMRTYTPFFFPNQVCLFIKYVDDLSFIIPSEIFSPESAGSRKISKVMDERRTQGTRRFKA